MSAHMLTLTICGPSSPPLRRQGADAKWQGIKKESDPTRESNGIYCLRRLHRSAPTRGNTPGDQSEGRRLPAHGGATRCDIACH